MSALLAETNSPFPVGLGHGEALANLRNVVVTRSPINPATIYFNGQILQRLQNWQPESVPQDPLKLQVEAISALDCFADRFGGFLARAAKEKAGTDLFQLDTYLVQIRWLLSAHRDLTQHEIAPEKQSHVFLSKPYHTSNGSFRIVSTEHGFQVLHIQAGRLLRGSSAAFAQPPHLSVRPTGEVFALGKSSQGKFLAMVLREGEVDPFDAKEVRESLAGLSLVDIVPIGSGDTQFLISATGPEKRRFQAVLTVGQNWKISIARLDPNFSWMPRLDHTDYSENRRASGVYSQTGITEPSQHYFSTANELKHATLPTGYRLLAEQPRSWDGKLLFRASRDEDGSPRVALFRLDGQKLKRYSTARVWNGKSWKSDVPVNITQYNLGISSDLNVVATYEDAGGNPVKALGWILCSFTKPIQIHRPLPKGSKVVACSNGSIVGLHSGKNGIQVFSARGTSTVVTGSKGWNLIDQAVTNDQNEAFHAIVHTKSSPPRYAILNVETKKIVSYGGKTLETLAPMEKSHGGLILVRAEHFGCQALFKLDAKHGAILLFKATSASDRISNLQFDSFSTDFFLAQQGKQKFDVLSVSKGSVGVILAEPGDQVVFVKGLEKDRCWLARRHYDGCILHCFSVQNGVAPISVDLSPSEITGVYEVFSQPGGAEVALVARKGRAGCFLFNLKTREFVNDQTYSYEPHQVDGAFDSQGRLLVTISRYSGSDLSKKQVVTVVVKPDHTS